MQFYLKSEPSYAGFWTLKVTALTSYWLLLAQSVHSSNKAISIWATTNISGFGCESPMKNYFHTIFNLYMVVIICLSLKHENSYSALSNVFIPFFLPCPWQMEVFTSSSQEQTQRSTLLFFQNWFLFVSQIRALLGPLLSSFSISPSEIKKCNCVILEAN